MKNEEKRYLQEILENQIENISSRFDRYENKTDDLYDEFNRKLDKVIDETTKNSTHIKVQYGLLTLLISALVGAILKVTVG